MIFEIKKSIRRLLNRKTTLKQELIVYLMLLLSKQFYYLSKSLIKILNTFRTLEIKTRRFRSFHLIPIFCIEQGTTTYLSRMYVIMFILLLGTNGLWEPEDLILNMKIIVLSNSCFLTSEKYYVRENKFHIKLKYYRF